MLSQKPISLRINNELLNALDEYCKICKRKRNAVINQAIKKYLEKG